MMKNKGRDMSRSVLASTRRDAKKDKRAVNKRYRMSVRNAISTFDGDDINDSLINDGKRRSNMQFVVRDRREADKLGPLYRWAESVAANSRPLDRERRVRNVLPIGPIGDHAWLHVSTLDSFRVHEHEVPWWRTTKEDRFMYLCERYERWVNIIGWLIDNDLMVEFGKLAAKHYNAYAELRRPVNDFVLYDRADIDAFLAKSGERFGRAMNKAWTELKNLLDA